MSRSGTRDTNVVPADKRGAFVTLMEKLTAHHGSEAAACRVIGMNNGHWTQVKNGDQNLSVTFARKILAAYKAIK